MASVPELMDAFAEFARSAQDQSAQTNDAIRALAAIVGTTVAGAGGGGPPVLTALQTVRKSTETTVQLSLSDMQYTFSETGTPVGTDPATGITAIFALPETTPAQVVVKSETSLDFHRSRGFNCVMRNAPCPMGHG